MQASFEWHVQWSSPSLGDYLAQQAQQAHRLGPARASRGQLPMGSIVLKAAGKRDIENHEDSLRGRDRAGPTEVTRRSLGRRIRSKS